MPQDVQTVLGVSAQIGNQFDRYLLAEVCKMAESKMMQILNIAMQENFIISMDREFEVIEEDQVSGDLVLTKRELLPDSPTLEHSPSSERQSTFRFGHDRIQQASATLVPPESVPAIHYAVAEILLDRYQFFPKLIDEHLLLIVSHLNKG